MPALESRDKQSSPGGEQMNSAIRNLQAKPPRANWLTPEVSEKEPRAP